MLTINNPYETNAIVRDVEFPNIADKIKQKILAEKTKQYACNSLWASEAAHDCTRYLVYQQCNWEEGKQTEDDLLLIFNEGNNQEDRLLLDLQNAGIKIKDLQVQIKIAAANITGKLDCVAVIENENGQSAFLPVEIKSMSDTVYNAINTVEDFQKYHWTRKYYGQMQIYLKNDLWFYPEGYFLVKNKSTGAIKIIKDFDGGNTIKFNETYWNELVKRGKLIKKYVKKIKNIQYDIENIETSDMSEKEKISEINALKIQIKYPDRIEYDLKVCKGCKYEHICITDIKGQIGAVIENKSILDAVDKYYKAAEKRPLYKEIENEYQNTLKILKELFPLQAKMYFSPKYLIETKVINGKNPYLGFDVQSLESVKNNGKKIC